MRSFGGGPPTSVGPVNDSDDRTGRTGSPMAWPPARLLSLAQGLGWRRLVLARRVAAGLLVLAALVLAIRAPDAATGTAPVVVAARELASGSTVRAGDVEIRRWPSDLVPAAALTTLEQV